jgi:hypothetical protein
MITVCLDGTSRLHLPTRRHKPEGTRTSNLICTSTKRWKFLVKIAFLEDVVRNQVQVHQRFDASCCIHLQRTFNENNLLVYCKQVLIKAN